MIRKNAYGIKGINDRKLRITYINPLDLMPNSYNPNSHETKTFDLLCKSIAIFGFTQPIVVDKNTMEIIDGEHRWRASCVLELELVPICLIDLTEEQKRLATIMHNEARGKHSVQAMDEINSYLSKKGVDLEKELLRDH